MQESESERVLLKVEVCKMQSLEWLIEINSILIQLD